MVSIKLFALPAGTDDHAVLALLMCHVRYRDSYGSTGDKDMETRSSCCMGGSLVTLSGSESQSDRRGAA
ncbi:MAG TPA: hypothetical protein VLZ05_18230 [Mycobacterium sp.]|nr:hypothetical protein [Mycobacterium sp.]HUH70626.1 hypothetical protein [Mycobacterium sp.]